MVVLSVSKSLQQGVERWAAAHPRQSVPSPPISGHLLRLTASSASSTDVFPFFLVSWLFSTLPVLTLHCPTLIPVTLAFFPCQISSANSPGPFLSSLSYLFFSSPAVLTSPPPLPYSYPPPPPRHFSPSVLPLPFSPNTFPYFFPPVLTVLLPAVLLPCPYTSSAAIHYFPGRL